MKKISLILLFISASLFIGVTYVSRREQKRIDRREMEKEFDSLVRANQRIIFLLHLETKRIQDSIRIEQIKLLK